MEPTTKKLRPYQVRLVTDVCRATEDVLVEQPTGSGKTVQIVTLVAMQLGRRFTHAVIAAPQTQIEQGFTRRDYDTVVFPASQGVAVPSIRAPNLPPQSLIKGARDSGLGSVKRVIQYLRQPGPLDHAFACTHAALNRITAADLPADLSGKALFIDEAHHASADGLAQVVTSWRERGGQLFFFTATPYRGDGRPVRLEGMRAFRRSLAEHMAEGFAPRHLESEIVALGQPGDVITAGQFTGEEAPPSSYFDGLVAAICRRWLEDGNPKAIVRVPPMQGGRSGELVSRLMQALAAQGARVLDATGTSVTDKQRFLTALEAEKNRTFATSGFDVMVGIQRVLEGTDWPVCSAVYCVGMPGSLNTVVQFLGRAMRLKGEDYPAAHRDRARLVFFVPCGGGAALADLKIDHSRHALLTCCFLADHEVGQEWIVLREVRRGIEAALGSRPANPAAADAENEADEAIDPQVRAEVELAMANAREQIISSGGQAMAGEVVQLAARIRPDLPEAALHRVAAEILAAQTTDSGTAVREAIQQEIAKRLRIDPMVKQAMAQAFAVVLDEFRAVTLQDAVVLESVGRQLHGVTGGQMREFAERLRDAAPRPLTKDQVLAWADAHYQRTGKWPTIATGCVVDAPDETWANIHAALYQGQRGLPSGSSLARLLAEARGVPNIAALAPLPEHQILAWADAHFVRTGQWPTPVSGLIQESNGEKWRNVQNALRIGLRGLPGGSSLAQLLAERRGAQNLSALPSLTQDQILAWADAHHESTGEWPNSTLGSINDAPKETWVNVNQALCKGLRGLPGGYSLAQLLADERGARNPSALAPLTMEQILAWADAHHERTGELPFRSAGPIHDAPDETWANINQALRIGLRGLPGGSSLARLLAQERGVRNVHDLVPLTEKQILTWADTYQRRTGEWPKATSDSIDGPRGETWKNVDASLRQGGRGLPGGYSLAQLLADHRQARNVANLTNLTEETILGWAEAHYGRTSHWPRTDSGPISGTADETWRNIDSALRQGHRGLQYGSSLAKLLAVKRGVRNRKELPPFTLDQILAWADGHYERTGKWPGQKSGPIHDAPGETWTGVAHALHDGIRGLPGGSSLAQLLSQHRGVRHPVEIPRLDEETILGWADAHYQRTGHWPNSNSGSIHDVPGETWANIHQALGKGYRGLQGSSSLPQLLAEHRGVRNIQNLPGLSVAQILKWVDAHFDRMGEWPTREAGKILDAPGETWMKVNQALGKGLRNLPFGSSLARLIREHRNNDVNGE